MILPGHEYICTKWRNRAQTTADRGVRPMLNGCSEQHVRAASRYCNAGIGAGTNLFRAYKVVGYIEMIMRVPGRRSICYYCSICLPLCSTILVVGPTSAANDEGEDEYGLRWMRATRSDTARNDQLLRLQSRLILLRAHSARWKIPEVRHTIYHDSKSFAA